MFSIAAAMAIAVPAVAGAAEPDCTTAEAAVAAARPGVSEEALLKAMSALQRLPGVPPYHCASATGLNGGNSVYCAWAFPFRSPAAEQVYSDLLALFEDCGEEVELSAKGARVNHPDSYEQKVFLVGGRTISLALKDKGGLEKTLIFVRVETLEK